MAESAFLGAEQYSPRETVAVSGVELPAYFAAPAEEYAAAKSYAVLFDRSDRTLLRVTGRDARSWLHNLVTNAVKTLEAGRGVYVFAADVRGRTLFDLNILALEGELWLDLDRAAAPGAQEHLEKHIIMEDVRLEALTPPTARLAVSGPAVGESAVRLGVPQFAALPALAHVGLADAESTRLVRHDFAGGPGFELILPQEQARSWWRRMAADLGVRAAGWRTLDLLRIEAGIPWLGRDIDEKVIPPETGQIERGISYHKGCYLGQEVIERMRSHGSMARQLVRVEMDDWADLDLPAALTSGGQDAGRITSLVRNPETARWVGLGYLRTKVTGDVGTTGQDQRPVRIVERVMR
jgi:folate-binding protein YgfZ